MPQVFVKITDIRSERDQIRMALKAGLRVFATFRGAPDFELKLPETQTSTIAQWKEQTDATLIPTTPAYVPSAPTSTSTSKPTKSTFVPTPQRPVDTGFQDLTIPSDPPEDDPDAKLDAEVNRILAEKRAQSEQTGVK